MNVGYVLLMGAAIGAGVLISRRTQAGLSLDRGQRLGIGLGAFCGAMIGAKLPFVLADWPGLVSGNAWFSDGKTIVFGLVGGYFGVELAKRALDVRVRTGDSFVLPVAVAVGIGRLACFVAGCCYGVPTDLPWGIDFGDGLRRHPTQLYECAFHLSAATVFWVLWRQHKFPGQLIKLYILTYLVYRFFSEFIRPEPRIWQGLTGYQWATLALAVLFGCLWFQDSRAIRRERTVAVPDGQAIDSLERLADA